MSEEGKKPQSFREALPKEEEAINDEALRAELLDKDGNLIVDLSLPPEYELELKAQQLLAHLTAYAQNEQAYKAARARGDDARRTQLWSQMQFNQLTAAIIQRAYPKAKARADELAMIQLTEAKMKQRQLMAQGEE